MRVLALTQGDPAGVGPEQLLGLLSESSGGYRPLVVAEQAALEALKDRHPEAPWDRLCTLSGPVSRDRLPPEHTIPVLDPVGSARRVVPGQPGAQDAAGALAALDLGISLVQEGVADALVTGPVCKWSIARHCRPGFRGQTEYLAAACGLESYGRDFLMAFLGGGLQVALLTTHLSLREAIARVTEEGLLGALHCLARHVAGRIAVPGLNPHAGEDGLLGDEEKAILVPALERARGELPGREIVGPETPDSVFGRAAEGEVDWVLALYHDQGLIAMKTHAWGRATNWTLGLPILRTSVDHGTAFDIAGQGRVRIEPLRHVVETTLALLAGVLPRQTHRRGTHTKRR